MRDHDPDVEQVTSRRRDYEEIHGSDGTRVVPEKVRQLCDGFRPASGLCTSRWSTAIWCRRAKFSNASSCLERARTQAAQERRDDREHG